MNDGRTTEVNRRNDYKPAHPQEQFIVPLLKFHIEDLIKKYGSTQPTKDNALDIGCGRQPFRDSLMSANLKYIGLDIEQNADGTVDIICPIDKPLPDELLRMGQFNFVLCTEVLEHVADWELAFKNFSVLTAVGGRLLITCPHFYQLHEEPYDFWRPTPYALEHFANKFGFELLEQKRLGDAWDVLGTWMANCYPMPISSKFKHRMMSRLVRFAKDRVFKSLLRRSLQSAVEMNGPLFLSNLVVLQRS